MSLSARVVVVMEYNYLIRDNFSRAECQLLLSLQLSQQILLLASLCSAINYQKAIE